MFFPQLSNPESKHKFLSSVLKKYKVFPADILSLGHRNNDGLGLFAESSKLWGVLSDKEKLIIAKETLPDARLYANSLSGWRVPAQMNMIYCLSQEMNKQPAASREKIFSKVSQQLHPYGLFIFDMMTNHFFDGLCKQKGETIVNEQEVSLSTWKKTKAGYKRSGVRLIAAGDGRYDRDESVQAFQTLSFSELKSMLKSSFESVSFVTAKGKKVSGKTEHVVVICQKGW